MRDRTALCLVILDIDYFKQFNDRYGHYAGDLILQHLGVLMREKTRAMDVVCRYGGEEFVLVMPNASLPAGIQRVEEMRASISMMRLEHQGSVLQTTLSAGIAEFPRHGATAEALLQSADRALYIAKAAGRNCSKSADECECLQEIGLVRAQ